MDLSSTSHKKINTTNQINNMSQDTTKEANTKLQREGIDKYDNKTLRIDSKF